MIDREKILTWLEICGKNNDCSGCCPYSENGFGEYGQCRESLMADAYDLLKEQEAVEPHQAEAVIWHAGTEHIYLIDTCGACNERIEEDAVFCSRCGRRILWQGR